MATYCSHPLTPPPPQTHTFFPSAELPSDPLSFLPPVVDPWLKFDRPKYFQNTHGECVSNIGSVALGINTGMVQEASID